MRGEGFDASEDGTGRGIPLVATTLTAREGKDPDSDATTTLIPFDPTQITHPENRSNPQPGDPCHTLAKAAHAPAIAFTCKDHGQDAGELSPTLRSLSGEHANGGGQVAIAFNARQDPDVYGGVSGSLGAKDTGHGLAVPSGVRRLTPRECERLQGFPDDYTLIPIGRKERLKLHELRERKEKMAADGPRYKALGNSMAVPCMRWLGERILAADSPHPTNPEGA